MRLIDIIGHFQIAISSEESVFLNKIQEKIAKSELSDREQVLAHGLVVRGVLNRDVNESETFFSIRNKI